MEKHVDDTVLKGVSKTKRDSKGRYLKGTSGNRNTNLHMNQHHIREGLKKAFDLPDVTAVYPQLWAIVGEKVAAGDLKAIELVLSRIAPPLKSEYRSVQVKGVTAGMTVGETLHAIAEAVVKGEIPADLGSQMSSLLSDAQNATTLENLSERLTQLESSQAEIRQLRKLSDIQPDEQNLEDLT